MVSQNILSGTRVYLAGPIEYDINAESWRKELSEFLALINITIYNPLQKPQWMPAICHTNIADRKNMSGDDVEYSWDLDRLFCISLVISADWLICRLDAKTKTFGTTEELGLAKQLGKPVIMWCPDGWPSPWVESMFRGSILCHTKDELYNIVRDIDNNLVQLNPLSWIGASYKKDQFNASF